MLKHTINLAVSALLAAFATPSAAGPSTPDGFRAGDCGHVCIVADGVR